MIQKNKLTFLVTLFCCFSLVVNASEQFLPVVPTPQSFVAEEGAFEIGVNLSFKGNNRYAKRLVKALKKEIVKAVPNNEKKCQQLISFKLDKKRESLSKEGYTIIITSNQINLIAKDEAGLFYGKQTLVQLFMNCSGKLPCGVITDAPRFEWRGYMLDESRHFFGKEKVKQYLDMMAFFKLNVFHWHLTDEPGWRIEIKKYPNLTKVGAVGNWHDSDAAPQYYTQKEIKEIVKYAEERHIMIVPEFDMPGHATSATRSYPELSGGGVGRWKGFTFHPCKEETFRFIETVFDELFKLFPSPYIHIGGDEVHFGNKSWDKDPMIQAFIKEKKLKGKKELEFYFLNKVTDIVASKGRTVIGWDEIVEAKLPTEKAMVMWWRHDKPQSLLNALKNGYQVIMTPRRPMYGDFVQDKSHKIGRRWGGFNPVGDVYDFPRTYQGIVNRYKAQIKGIQYSVWTERIADAKRLDFMTFPRLLAVANAGWSELQVKDRSAFMQLLPRYFPWFKAHQIYFFNPFNVEETPEPFGPSKQDVLQNG